MKKILSFVVAFYLTVALQSAFAQTAEDLFQKGVQLEEVKGELEQAIEIYKTVVSKYPANKPLAAKSLLRMGLCYEKLGFTEAKKAYERIVREFADQREVAAEARTRLAMLTKAENGREKPVMTSRQVWTVPRGAVIYGTVSHDGRYLPYADWRRKGDLFLWDIASGATREIDNKRSGRLEFAELGGAFSPGDTQLAYGWFNNDHDEVRVAGLQAPGGSVPRVLFSNPEVPIVSPEDWSQDGKWLAVQLRRKDKTAQIGLIEVQDGSLRILKSVDWRGSSKLFFSPDSKYLAYDLPTTDVGDQRDVFVLAIDGSREIPAVGHPSNDVLVGWSPDGRRLLFTSDRTGSTGLWSLAFVDGKPQGSPEQIKVDFTGTSMGLTRKGTLYSFIHRASFTGVVRSDIQVAAFDFAKGQFLSTPVSAVQTFVGANNFPAWSPDGKHLAFLSRRGKMAQGQQNTVIGILSQDTGQLRELRPELNVYVGGAPLRWSPDGLSLAIQATDSKGRQGIFRVDAATGEATPIALSSRGPVGEGESFTGPMWAPDGKRIYYKRAHPAAGLAVIVERELSSGNEKEIFRRSLGASWNPHWMFVDLSPDGKYLAAVDNNAWPGHNTGEFNVVLIPAIGGQPKELMRGESQGAGVLMWAPDSRSIFVYSIKDGSTGDREVWRVAIDGTESQKLSLNVNSLGPPFNSDQQLHAHPDGKQVAFAATEPAKPGEVWALENFLPRAEIEPTLTIRKVSPGGYFDIMGAPSSDGRYFTFVDWDTGDLAVYELATGKKRRLTNKGSWTESSEHAEFSIMSPDGKQAAYTWFNKDGVYDLRVIGSDGSNPRAIYLSEEVTYFQPSDWSTDGKSILVVLFRKDNTNQIALISPGDGSARVLKTLGWSPPGKMSLSPDGRYIVFDMPQKEDAPERDIFVLAADGSREIPLVQHPADDKVLGWTPDGKWILFSSDRTGTMSAWAIRVEDGRPQGAPEIIKTDIGRIFPLGFTSNGSFYYGLLTGMHDAYTATLDLIAGKVAAPPKAINERLVGSTTAPTWSPDGKSIAYIWRQTAMFGFSPSAIVIRSIESEQERRISPAMAYLNRLRWSPDGRVLLVSGRDKKGRWGIFQIDVQTGDTSPIVTGKVNQPLWSPDGKAILYVSTEEATKTDRILIRDLGTTEEKELYRSVEPYQVAALTISPDGKQLAFCLSGAVSSTRLMVMSTSGGVPREVLQLKDPERIPTGHHGVVEWAEGGRKILFVKRSGETEGMELWQMPAEGGKAQNLGVRMELLHGLRVHPDGKQIAFAGGQNKTEVWVMENFLPREEKETKASLTLKKLSYAQLNTPFARLSPDGKNMAYIEYVKNEPQKLHVLNFNSSTDRVLVEGKIGGQFGFIWSPDSKSLAYTYENHELRAVGVDGSGHKTLLKNLEYGISPSDWSRDGKYILCELDGKDWTAKIAILSVRDSSFRVLISGNSRQFRVEPKFSPDAKYVTCAMERDGNTDVYVWAADGTREIRLTDYPGRDEYPHWSPDGNYLVFLSDRSKNADLWGVKMDGGAPVGPPFIIKRDIGWRTRIHDLTATGKLNLLMVGGAEPPNLFTFSVDQETGSSSGSMASISIYPTDHFSPRWSPDGRKVAYLSRKGQIGWPRLFVLREDGSEQELPLEGHYIINVTWNNDGSSLLFPGWDQNGKAALFQISLGTQEIKTLYAGERIDIEAGSRGALVNLHWLPAARKFMFFKLLGKGDSEIHSCGANGEDDKVLLSRVHMPSWGQPSPDGNYVAYQIDDTLRLVSSMNGVSRIVGYSSKGNPVGFGAWSPDGKRMAWREGKTLKTLSLSDFRSDGIFETSPDKIIGDMSWSPNGKFLVFSVKDTSRTSLNSPELYITDVNGGSTRRLAQAPAGYTTFDNFSWSPDGKKILASGATSSRSSAYYEYWVMENFLSKEEKEISYQKSVKLLLSGTGWEGSGAISPDESRIAYVDYSSNWGDLIVNNLRTGASQTLVDAKGYYEEFAGYPLWSPNGKHIVYYWYLNKEPWFDLRIVSPEGGEPKVLYSNRELTLFPKDWSPDTKAIVCEILRADKSVALGVLSVGSGEVRQLLSLEWNRLADARFSPDGNFIVYEISKEGNRDLYTLSLDGKQSTRLTDSPAEDSNPVWSLDGRYIFFSSNRRGVWDLWGVAMRGGNTVGEPFLVQSDHGNYRKMITASGKMFYNVGNDLSDVFYVEMNPATGEILSQPKLSTKSFYGQHQMPTWAPDGKRIAYIRRGEPSLLCILSTVTGKEECMETGMRYFNRLFWSPDGKFLALSPAGKTGKNGVYLFSLDKRELRPMIEMSDFRPKGWSADGKEFILVKEVWSAQHSKIESQKLISVEFGTGKERTLLDSYGMTETSQYDFVPSPDQKLVVFVERDPELKGQKLIVTDINQKTKKILVTVTEPPNSIDSPRWSPDGTKIVYNFMTQVGGSLMTELRIVSANGTWDRKVETGKAVANWTPASWSPDGSKLAFTLTEGTINELWVMENFLPIEGRAQK